MRKILTVFAVTFSLLFTSVFVIPASPAQALFPSDCNTTFVGLPAWFKYLDGNGECDVVGPSDDNGGLDWPAVAGRVSIAIVEALLRVASLVAVGYVIYGGFRYMTSQGNPEGAASARSTIINALVGLVIAVASASIVAFIGQRLGSSSSTPPQEQQQNQQNGGGSNIPQAE